MGALSGRGWQSQVTRASGVTSATVLPSASSAWRSIGTAFAPASHSRRLSCRRASSRATSSGPSTRWVANVGPRPTLMPRSGPVSRLKASSSVRSSPTKIAAVAPDLVAQGVERVALVGLDDRQLDDLLALARVHARQPRGALSHGRQGRGGVLLRGLPVVQGGARGLVLDDHAGRWTARCARRSSVTRSRSAQRLRGERAREADVELGAVAADEMDLLRQSRERCEVVQRAAGDHGHAGVAERGQRAQRRDRLAARPRLAGHVDDRRERAVVVAGDEQVRLAREPRECLLERLHVAVRVLRAHAAGSARASRNDAGEAVDVVRADLAAHLAHAPARLALGQRDGARNRLAQPDDVVGIHEQRLAQLARGTGELREHERAAAAVAGGHVLLADQVHAIAQRRHEHDIGSGVQGAKVLARQVVMLVVDRRVTEAAEFAVDAARPRARRARAAAGRS